MPTPVSPKSSVGNELFQLVPIFAGLETPALEFLAGLAKESEVKAGEVVVREHEPGNRFYVITAGSVRVCKRYGQPDELELAVLHAGNFFGEMCILETLPRSATVYALGRTRLLGFSSISFYHFYQAMPAQYSILLLNIARDLSRRLRRLDEAFAARS
jgi:CRP/FNR family cyclic AMP-dependent transcriptional regulator